MKPKSTLRHFLCIASSAVLTISYAHATNLYWDDNTGANAGAGGTPTGIWGTDTNWNTDSLGGAAGALQIGTVNTDDLFFVAAPGAASGNAAYIVTVNSAQVANSLTFQTSGATTLSGGTSITLGDGAAGGITMNQFAYGAVAQGTVTISTALSLANSQTWTNHAANKLQISNFVSTSTGQILTLTGTGQFNFPTTVTGISGGGSVVVDGVFLNLISGGNQAVNSYTGTTTVQNGGYILHQASNFGTGNINLNGGYLDGYYNSGFTRTFGTGPSQFQITGGLSGFGTNGNGNINLGGVTEVQWGSASFNPSQFLLGSVTSSAGTTTFQDGIDLNGVTRTFTGASTVNAGAVSGVIRDALNLGAGLIKTGVGTLTLSGANTFNGVITVNQGTLGFSGNANVASANPLGQSSAAAANLLLANGTTLQYSGAEASANRSFTINGTAAGHGASLNASGTGAINFTNTASPAYGTVDQTRTLTLTGINIGNNILAALISDNGTGALSLTKSGAGQWNLSNASNSYTGVTTISGGVLKLDVAAALPGGIGATGGTSNLTFNGGVLGLLGTDFTRDLNTAATPAAATFTGAGGWAAYGANRIVNLNNDGHQIVWATAGTGFNGQTLILSNAFSGFTLDFQNGIDLGTATRTIQVDDGTATVDAKLSGVITGGAGGVLTKTGAGSLTLSGSNNYTGVTTVSGGVLLLDNANALPGGIADTGGTSNLTFNGGVVGLTADFTRSLNTAATVTAATFTGAGGWAAYGADRLVNLGGAAALITWATAGTGFNGQTLILGANSATHQVDLVNPLALGNAARALRVDNGSAAIDAELSGAISGAGGSITRTGAGNLLISGNMSQTGGISISTANGGTTYLSGTNTYSGNTVNAFSAATQGTLVFQGMQAVSNTTTLTQTHAGGVGGFGSISFLDDSATPTTKNGFGLSMSAANTSHGMTLFVGNNNTANGGNSAGTTTGSTITLGNLSIAQTNAGNTSQTFTVSGANGYRLQIGSVSLTTLTTLTAWSAIFNPGSAPLTISGNVTQTNPSATVSTTLQLDGGASGNRIEGNILQPLGAALKVTKANSSSWTLSGTNTYTGATTISGGTLIGTNAVQSFGTNLSGISIQGSGTLSLRNDSTVSFTNGTSAYNIANSAPLATINVDRVTGAGTNTITVGNLTTSSTAAVWGLNFTGANGVSLNAGTLNTPVSTAGSQVHTITNNIDNTNGASLTLASVFNQATIVGSPDLAFAGTGKTVITGAITQTFADMELKKSGTGTLLLNGANTYTGLTTVNAGTLGGTGTIAGDVTVAAAGSLAPGASAGTLNITGGLTVTAMATPVTGTGKLVFELGGNTAASDQIITGSLAIGGGVLGFSDFTFANLPGGPQNGTYILIESGTPITGTLDPDSVDLTGPVGSGTGILAISGNNIVLNVSGITGGGDPYAAWAGAGVLFDADANNDGVNNGMAWLLGAPNKDANAVGLLPKVSQSSGNLILNFTCLKVAGRGTAVLKLQHSKDLGITDLWTVDEVSVPDAAGVAGVTDIITFTVPSVNGNLALVNLQATIPASAASPGSKLFGRLKAIKP